jgi:hypothetical protein
MSGTRIFFIKDIGIRENRFSDSARRPELKLTGREGPTHWTPLNQKVPQTNRILGTDDFLPRLFTFHVLTFPRNLTPATEGGNLTGSLTAIKDHRIGGSAGTESKTGPLRSGLTDDSAGIG